MVSVGKKEAMLRDIAQYIDRGTILLGDKIKEDYQHDAGTLLDHYKPDAVVFPRSAKDVAWVLRLANRYRIPVTPRGGGTGLAGAAVPIEGGILLDMKNMNHILAIDTKGYYAVVEAGVRTSDLQAEAAKKGLLYAGDPCSNDSCEIAGNIATNAGGNRAVKYGVTADQIYSLEVVTPLGEVVSLGGRVKKNATGYNLLRLIAGSEGTLGIVTKATLKLYPLAAYMPTYLVVADKNVAISLVERLCDFSQLPVVSLEIIDEKTAKDMERYQQKNIFSKAEGTCLLIQLEAYDEKDLKYKQSLLQRILSEREIKLFQIACPDVWKARRAWGKAVRSINGRSYAEDVVVPVDTLHTFLAIINEMGRKYNYEFRFAGHAGDGNMHLAVLPGDDDYGQAAYREELYSRIYALGGRLSGEHGIGYKRKAFLEKLASPMELELMKKIKLAWDPNSILNPGKIFS